jgi:hypothetical protein
MSLDSGGTWVALVTTGHTGNKSVQVRVKATATTLASPATILTFTETVVPPTPNTAPTAVTFAASSTLTAGSLTVGQVVGQLSCVDFAPT